MKKYVLTGGLSVGKTTILKNLKDRGYSVIDEVSNMLVNDYQKVHGSESFPWDNGKRLEYQKEVLENQLQKELSLEETSDKIVFLDRGVPDGIPFFILDHIEIPEEIWQVARNNRYDRVFFVESLPSELYEDATHRPQRLKLATKRLEKMLLETYEKLDYSPIKVPVLSPEKRADFVLKNLV